ncbi:hypothetical protein [Lysobacter gummosus]
MLVSGTSGPAGVRPMESGSSNLIAASALTDPTSIDAVRSIRHRAA